MASIDAYEKIVLAGADVMKLVGFLQAAVGVVRAAMAGGAADLLAEEQRLAQPEAAPGHQQGGVGKGQQDRHIRQ